MSDEIQPVSSPAPHSLFNAQPKESASSLPSASSTKRQWSHVATSARRQKTQAYNFSVATATQRSPLSMGRRHSKPRNGDLEFSEELTMTALLYRGHS
ncbi:hypothetical protein FZX09_08255, partial [Synechococcus sp. MU1643]|nr:hypothetical protein [Synechococcus sp. MU1643]